MAVGLRRTVRTTTLSLVAYVGPHILYAAPSPGDELKGLTGIDVSDVPADSERHWRPCDGGVRPVDSALYENLGVPVCASTKEIRKAFRRRSRELHPDKRRIGLEEHADAQERFLKLLKAYEVLGSEARRRVYDEEGHEAGHMSEWLRALRRNGPAVAMQRLHRVRLPMRQRIVAGCVVAPARLSGTISEECANKQIDASAEQVAERMRCEDEGVMRMEDDMLSKVNTHGVKKNDAHLLTHVEVMQDIRASIYNVTQLPPERLTPAATASVSYGLMLAAQSAAECAKRRGSTDALVNYAEVGGGGSLFRGASTLLVQAFLEVAGARGLALSVAPVSAAVAGPDEECRALGSWLRRWAQAWPRELSEYFEEDKARALASAAGVSKERTLTAVDDAARPPTPPASDPCGPAWRTAGKILHTALRLDVDHVDAPGLEALGAGEVERRGWSRSFGIVHLHAAAPSYPTPEGLVADVLLATHMLRPSGILIIEDWTAEAFTAPVPGLYGKGRKQEGSLRVPLSLRASLDRILVPVFQTWKQLMYVVPDEDVPLLPTGSRLLLASS